MRFFPFYFALFLLIAGVAGCVEEVEEEIEIDKATHDEAAIKAFNEIAEQWDAGVGAGDADAIAALLTDDYVRMNPDEPIIEGKEAFLESLRAFLEENDVRDSKNVIVEVRLAGDWACVRGAWTGVRTPKATGEAVSLSGKWVDIRELQPDGSWKISLTIANRDAPLPIPAE